MSTTKAGARSKPGLPDDYWRKSYEMRGTEIDRLRAILARALVWLDGDDSDAWMADARNAVQQEKPT